MNAYEKRGSRYVCDSMRVISQHSTQWAGESDEWGEYKTDMSLKTFMAYGPHNYHPDNNACCQRNRAVSLTIAGE